MEGRTGRVIGKVGPGLVGEVMIAIRGGTEAFNAFLYDPTDSEILPGSQVAIVEYQSPRTVYVALVR